MACELKIGDWATFAYVDRKYEFKVWTGEVKEYRPNGYLMMTENGYRHFKIPRMSNVVRV